MLQESRVKKQESRVKNQESRIKNQESRIKKQESRVKKQEARNRTCPIMNPNFIGFVCDSFNFQRFEPLKQKLLLLSGLYFYGVHPSNVNTFASYNVHKDGTLNFGVPFHPQRIPCSLFSFFYQNHNSVCHKSSIFYFHRMSRCHPLFFGEAFVGICAYATTSAFGIVE